MDRNPAPTPNRTTANRTRRRMAGGALALLAAASLVACSTKGTTDVGDAPASTTTSAPADTTTSVPAGGPSSGGDQGGNQGGNQGSNGGGNQGGHQGGNSGGGNQDGGQTTTTLAPAPAPTITSFETPENIDCHNGNFQEFTASWTTTNAVEVTISIDGPGVYASYPANGSTSLPFNCSTPHTFLLTAHGQHGQTATETITLQPRNVQMPEQGEDNPE